MGDWLELVVCLVIHTTGTQPIVQLIDHHVGGGVVQAGDDQYRTLSVHWALSLPVSLIWALPLPSSWSP